MSNSMPILSFVRAFGMVIIILVILLLIGRV